MSDKEAKKPKPAEPEKSDAAPPPAKKPTKLIAIVAVAMIAEGAGVFMVASMTAKKPQQAAAATEIHGEEHADHEKTVEVTLLEEEFQTMQGSQVWIWDTQIVLKLKAKHQEFVEKELERRDSEVREAIATMFRRAQPTQLREPGLETLNRQVSSYVQKLMGKDAEGKERVERVMIPRCRGFGSS
jgi:flagellar basal body-associated protein FliL